MKTIAVEKAPPSLAKFARRVKREPMVFTAKGRPVAALVPVPNADLETVTLSNDPRFLAIIERSRARQRAEGGISTQEMRRRLGLKRKTRRR